MISRVVLFRSRSICHRSRFRGRVFVFVFVRCRSFVESIDGRRDLKFERGGVREPRAERRQKRLAFFVHLVAGRRGCLGRLVGRADRLRPPPARPRRPQLQGGLEHGRSERLVRRVGVHRQRRRRALHRARHRGMARLARVVVGVGQGRPRAGGCGPPGRVADTAPSHAPPRARGRSLGRRRTPPLASFAPAGDGRAPQHLARGRVPQVHLGIRGVAVYGTTSRGRAVRLRFGRPRRGRRGLPRRRVDRRNVLPHRRRARETSTRARQWRPRGVSNESFPGVDGRRDFAFASWRVFSTSQSEARPR